MASSLSTSQLKSELDMYYSSMKSEMGKYEELNEIGNGTYGTVYRGRDLINGGKIVAMKKIKIPFGKLGVPVTTLREIALLKQLDQQQHPNIVKLLDVTHSLETCYDKRQTFCLIFEHIEQDLDAYIDHHTTCGIPAKTVKSIMHQILSGVDFLHFNRVVHRDLKPSNILVTSDLRIKIADFGLAKLYDFEMKLTSKVVTLWYRAPEILLGSPYDTGVDLWSCGCIMSELYTLTPLFDGDSEGKQLDKIFSVIGLPSDLNWPIDSPLIRSFFKSYSQISLKTKIPKICSKGEDLLLKMLVFVSNERISACEALKHPYFSEL